MNNQYEGFLIEHDINFETERNGIDPHIIIKVSPNQEYAIWWPSKGRMVLVDTREVIEGDIMITDHLKEFATAPKEPVKEPEQKLFDADAIRNVVAANEQRLIKEYEQENIVVLKKIKAKMLKLASEATHYITLYHNNKDDLTRLTNYFLSQGFGASHITASRKRIDTLADPNSSNVVIAVDETGSPTYSANVYFHAPSRSGDDEFIESLLNIIDDYYDLEALRK